MNCRSLYSTHFICWSSFSLPCYFPRPHLKHSNTAANPPSHTVLYFQVHRLFFFWCNEWRWNVFDALLASLSALSAVNSLMESVNGTNMSFLRSFRFIKAPWQSFLLWAPDGLQDFARCACMKWCSVTNSQISWEAEMNALSHVKKASLPLEHVLSV